MSKFISFLRTFYGIGFLLGGFFLLFQSPGTGVMFMICGAFLFRPVTVIIEQKLKRQFSRNVKIAIVVVSGIIGISSWSSKSVEKQKQKKVIDQEAFNQLPKHERDSILFIRQKEKELQAAQKQKEERQEHIQSMFSSIDGSNMAITDYLKQKLDDPDSYEHVETKWVERQDRLIIYTTFRANNRFGAKIKQVVKAEVSLNNELLSMEVVE